MPGFAMCLLPLRVFWLLLQTASLRAVVGATGHHVCELFDLPGRPGDDDAIDAIAMSDAERDRELGLREIARAALDHPRLVNAVVEDPHGCANRITIGPGSHQAETQGAVAG